MRETEKYLYWYDYGTKNPLDTDYKPVPIEEDSEESFHRPKETPWLLYWGLKLGLT
jgi:hypothetical protein